MLPLALAASSGEGHLGFDWMQFAGKAVNSILLFGGLYYFLNKPVAALLRRKSQDIRLQTEQRQDRLVDLRQRVDALDKRLAELDGEVRKFREDALALGEQEERQLGEEAAREARRVMELAGEDLERRLRRQVNQMRADLLDEVEAQFVAQVASELTPERHHELIRETIERCGVGFEKP